MDNDLGRTDLLSADVPTLIVLLMMVALVTAWFFAHRLKERMPNRLSRGAYLLARTLVGTLALWSMWQFIGRLLVLETNWSLWVTAFVGACALEGVLALYQWERSIVSPRLGRALAWLRGSAVFVLLVMLVQPVFSREGERTIDRDVVVLVDDSESMQLTDKRLSISEKLEIARVFDVPAARKRYPLQDLQQEVATLQAEVKRQTEALVLPPSAGDESKAHMLAKRRAALSELVLLLNDGSTRGLAYLADTRQSEQKFQGPTQDLLRDFEQGLREKMNDQRDRIQTRVEQAEATAQQYDDVVRSLTDISTGLGSLLQRLPRAISETDEVLYRALSDADRRSIDGMAEQTRAAIARRLLVGQGEELPGLIPLLGNKYNLHLVRFAQDPVDVDLAGYLQDGSTNAVNRVVDPKLAPSTESGESDPGKAFRQLTDIATALEYALKTVPSENLAGVLVLSDGRHNARTAVEDAARTLGVQDAPISTVVIGSRQGPKDASVLQVSAPESIYLGDKIVIKADLKFDGMRGESARVRLLYNEEVVDEVDLRIPEENFRFTQRFRHAPEEKGIFKYRLQIEDLDGELYHNNNEWDFETAVTDDRTNVLIVDGTPRWEFRYLRNLFYGRDKSVHLQFVLTEPDTIAGAGRRARIPASAGRAFGDAEATTLPESLEEWLKFDAIILGDVDPTYFTTETWEHIEYCVSRRGAMLVLIAGPRFMPHAYQEEAFANLCPINYQHSTGTAYESPEEAFRIEATSEGRNHMILQQAPSRTLNARIWGGIPPLMWRHAVESTKEGATVLAYAKPLALDEDRALTRIEDAQSVEQAIEQLSSRKQYERENPLVVIQKYELGKVAMFCTDRTWRLRYRVGDTYHHRLWGQVLRWGTGVNLRSGTDLVRLGTDQLSYTPHDPIKVIAKVIDEESRPVLDDKITVTLFKDDKEIVSKRLEYREDSNGLYEGLLNPIETPGRYRLELKGNKSAKLLAKDNLKTIETQLRIVTTKNPIELAELTASREIPTRMASLTGGSVASPGNAHALVDVFGEAKEVIKEKRETPLWHSWPLFLIFIGLVTTEWVLRKKGGLA
ncbi:MAG: hypothetical protein ACI9TH_000813 [Kiritimatiellia bacterium]|jgi:hypothetical protein